MLFTLFLLSFNICGGHVIQNQVENDSQEFSPYYAAFNEDLKKEIKEYERLKRQLKHFHVIDWDDIDQPKFVDSKSE